jgi:energy-coupling factor transport system substrate-specific component
MGIRELLAVWSNTRMIVLVAITAATYVAVMLPFKWLVLIPGFTEFRPGAAVPVVMSFLFGPAAAWGAAFGNLIGDVLGGMFGLGSIPGFIGNFMYGYLPYALWRAFLGHRSPVHSGLKGWLALIVILVANSLVIASLIGCGLDVLGLLPFAGIGLVIAVNNMAVSLSIGIPLLGLLYARIRTWGMLYHQILDEEEQATPYVLRAVAQRHVIEDDGLSYRPRPVATLAAAILIVGAFVAFFSGLLVSGEVLHAGYGKAEFRSPLAGSFAVAGSMLPGLLMILIAAALL